MPEIVRALASPLANVDKITIVSTGNGDSAGMNKITGDITKMAAQVPALFETLSRHAAGRIAGQSPPDRRQVAEAADGQGHEVRQVSWSRGLRSTGDAVTASVTTFDRD